MDDGDFFSVDQINIISFPVPDVSESCKDNVLKLGDRESDEQEIEKMGLDCYVCNICIYTVHVYAAYAAMIKPVL